MLLRQVGGARLRPERDACMFDSWLCIEIRTTLWVGVSFSAKQGAGLLAATEDHLGNLLASLYAAMPTLAACGFVASSAAQLQHVSFATTAQSARTLAKKESRGPEEDAVLAVASLAETLGVDMRGLQELVAGAQELMKNISR